MIGTMVTLSPVTAKASIILRSNPLSNEQWASIFITYLALESLQARLVVARWPILWESLIMLTRGCWGTGGLAQSPSITAITSVSASILARRLSIVFDKNISLRLGIRILRSFI